MSKFGHGSYNPQERRACSKKHALSLSEGSVQQGRSIACSVPQGATSLTHPGG